MNGTPSIDPAQAFSAGENADESESAGRGRPKKSPEEKRTNRYYVRCNDEEARQLEERAERTGKAPAVVLREAALGAQVISAEKRERREELIREISRVGNNVNQIARQLNAGEFVTRQAIKNAADDIRKTLRRVSGRATPDD